MLVEYRFFKWKEQEYIDPIRLGEDIVSLIDCGLITVNTENGKTEYQLTSDQDIWIGDFEGKVNYIYYTKSKGDKIIGLNTFDLQYPATEQVCEHLSKRFQPIPEIKSIDQLRQTRKGDFLYVIFRDFIPMNLFIIRIN